MKHCQMIASLVVALLLAANAIPASPAKTYGDTRKLLHSLNDIKDDRKVLASLFPRGDTRIDDLIKALHDPDPKISLRAQIVIGYLGIRTGMDALEDLYGKQNEIVMSGPIPLPLQERDYEFISDQFSANNLLAIIRKVHLCSLL